MFMLLRASSISRWQRWLSLVLHSWLILTVLGAGLFTPGLPWRSVAQAGAVNYVYDDLGRLLSVVDGTTGQAIYQYDAVGNLLGITNQAASVISLLNFTPKNGPVGTTVTISGTGFSATANQNTVTFNGTAATVTSATATQLVATVPGGATTGPIAVTVGSASATSSTPFTVMTSGALGAPTIASFTPTIVVPGTAVTISGTNFDSTLANNQVRINGISVPVTAATTNTLTITVPLGVGSGRITVTTPTGSVTSSAYLFIPVAGYTVADVVLTDHMAIGESKIVTIATSGKIALIVFEGTFGQRVTLQMTNVNFTGSSLNPLARTA